MSDVFFGPVGNCIYCGAADGVLTDEHIVPFGLDGNAILRMASCKPCSTITGKFEGTVLRGIYGDFRMHRNMRTRRKKERPEAKEIGTENGPASISWREYAAPLWIYEMGLSGFYLDAPPDLDVSIVTLSSIHDGAKLQELQTKYKWDSRIQFRFAPGEFMRMLAKIGYTYAVAELGYGSFRPIVLDAILKTGVNVSHFVGQNQTKDAPDPTYKHLLRIKDQSSPGRKPIVVSEVKLFASFQTPTYHIIVGEIDTPEQHVAIKQKLQNRQAVTPSLP
jgi:hypothetical protein